jgi:hypothetical protein
MGFIPSLKATFRELYALFDQMVEEHKTNKTDDDEPNRKDLVDILLKLQKIGMLDIEFTQDNLKAILLVSLSLSHTHIHTNQSLKLCFHNFRTCLWEEVIRLQQLWNG